MPHLRRTRIAVPALLSIAAVATGCGGDDSEKSTPQPAPKASSDTAPQAGRVSLAADPSGKIAFNTKTLNAKAGPTTIDFENASQVPHAVEVEGQGVEKETKTIQGGKATLKVDLKPGKYEFYCPVDSHKQQGMEGVLNVQ